MQDRFTTLTLFSMILTILSLEDIKLYIASYKATHKTFDSALLNDVAITH